ncbi:MAG: F0F1 ATP synthase subunit B [Bacteroidetes bacterium]|nr:F0F1 ATP synthase subunit B [Bacteroidota bacterium]
MLTGLNLSILIFAFEGGGTIIDVNPGVIFWTIVTFVILMFILKKVAWKPILTALDQRESSIRESLEKAENAKEEAEKILLKNQEMLSKADEESKKLVNKSRKYADGLKEQMLKESKEQAQKIVNDATLEIERQREAAFEELKSQVAEIAVQAAEKILRKNLNMETQKKIADNFINEITKN